MSLELHSPLTSNLDITVVAKDGDYDIGVYDSVKKSIDEILAISSMKQYLQKKKRS